MPKREKMSQKMPKRYTASKSTGRASRRGDGTLVGSMGKRHKASRAAAMKSARAVGSGMGTVRKTKRY